MLVLSAIAASTVTDYDLLRADRAETYFLGDRNQGYYRTEFNVPSGDIWRAVINVGEQGILYVNGQLVDFKPFFMRRQGFTEAYRVHAVDIEPYLNPGQRNCIALFFQRVGIDNTNDPMAYLHGKVIMSTGQQIILDMDTGNSEVSWKSTANEQSGWNQVGFNDASWDNLQRKILATAAIKYLESWPGYDGRLVFENPHPTEDKLFFKDNAAMIVDVVIPEGLTGDIKYVLEKVNEGGTYTQITTGTQSTFSNRASDKSKVYRLNIGTRPSGVYTLQVSLVSGNTTIETRIPEAMVVVGKVSQQEIDGSSLEQGLSLELEGEIDFTDPANTDWIESYTLDGGGGYDPDGYTTLQKYQPTIVDTGTLRYRQTYNETHAVFAYKYTFQHPGDWYLLVLEYPDDANRMIGLHISRLETPANYVEVDYRFRGENGATIMTGYKFPLSGEMKEFKLIHRADPGLHSVDIVAIKRGLAAAAKKIRIYHINNDELPVLSQNTNNPRRLGLQYESTIGTGVNFGINDPGLSGGAHSGYTYENLGYDMLQIKTQRLLWQLDVMVHHVQYMRFLGRNFYVVGTYMYMDDEKSYKPPYMIKTAEINPVADIRDVALRVFEVNNIEMMSTIEYSNLWGLRLQKDAVYGVNVNDTRAYSKDGKPVADATPQLNIAHHWIQQAFNFSMNQIAYKFSSNPAWKGFFFVVYPTFSSPSFWAEQYSRTNANADPLATDYSDATIAAFETDTGISVPDEPYDSGRFNRRYTFLTSSSMRDIWINWRIQFVRKFALMAKGILEQYRDDTFIIQGYYIDVPAHYFRLLKGMPYIDYLRLLSLDPSIYKNDNKMWVAHYMFPPDRNMLAYYLPDYPGYVYYSQYLGSWDVKSNPEVFALFDADNKRAVAFYEGWLEINYEYQADQNPAPWPVRKNYAHEFFIRPRDYYVQESFAYAMIGLDPQILMHGFLDMGDLNIYGQEYREFSQVFTKLPQGKFLPVLNTGFGTNLAIKQLQDGGTYWFYVVNPGYWNVSATLNLRNVNSVYEVGSSGTASFSNGNLYFNLRPFGIKAFKATTSSGGINSYSVASLSDSDLAHMRNLISLVKDSYPPVKSVLGIKGDNETFIINTANQAELDIANGNYASAWQKLTNWRYWMFAYDKIFNYLGLVARFRTIQTGANTVSFDAADSASYRKPIVAYDWIFGDGTTGSGKTVSHRYASAGAYTVRLTVKDFDGKTNLLTRNVTVSVVGANPADFNVDGVVDIYDVVFVASRIGTTDSRADVADPKGVIDMSDLIFVTSRFGQI
ncbi:MAG TPA: PKD domain-containing protein [Candidatus Nanoarchaeia archaeon]|nr:PKD domain-containing protein [Candidatus Nanoarchaeia archaeon]